MSQLSKHAPHIVFLTWVEHRRTNEIARHLGVQLLSLSTDKRGLSRYAYLTFRTIRALYSSRPRVVIVQSPSIVLAALALAMRRLLRYAVVIDAHNEAVEPYLHPSKVVRVITYWALRAADLVVVSNQALVRKVEERGGRAIVLPDRVPTPPRLSTKQDASSDFRVAVIATFAGDEPIDAVIEAARRIGPSILFSITGNASRLTPEIRASLPSNVTLTGFLPEVEYWELLADSHLVMDLTTMPDCLVCGAYEGLAVGKPLVLSDNEASRELFQDAALFTDNTLESLTETLERGFHQYGVLADKLPAARERIIRHWHICANELVAALERLSCKRKPKMLNE